MPDDQTVPAGDATTIRELKGGKQEDVLYVDSGRPLREVIDYLAQKHIGLALVIAADGDLAGVISERDAIRALYEHGGQALDLRVDMFMVRDVVTCAADDRVVDVARVMAERKFRHMPVVDDGYLAGMVSATDLVRYFAARL